MALDLEDIKLAREWGLDFHSQWKAQLRTNDAIASGLWQIAWGDGEVDDASPLVQNVYLGALEDKTNTAGAGSPAIFVPPPPGTTEDRGEKIAQKRKRVYQSYGDRSDMPKLRKKLYRDWLHAGAGFMIPWTDFFDENSQPTPTASRAPYFMHLDPRQAYPLAHDNRDRLVKIMFIRQRRVASLKEEYGANLPAFRGFKTFRTLKQMDDAEFLEEVWYFDSTYWGVALGDSLLSREHQGRAILPNTLLDSIGGSNLVWVDEPTKHGLGRCPVLEMKRLTHDGSYRGALEDVIPAMRTAQNFMARLLDDMEQNIYAPVVLDNIENEEDYGPGAILRGTGDGRAAILRDRPNVNFEAQRTVTDIISQAHRQATWPVQRSGDADASVVSAKGVVALAGSFNSELATAQQDMEMTLMDANRVAAAFDEKHCFGLKKIHVMEGVRAFNVKYDPAKLFKGDYRNKVSYGDSTGMDESNRLTKLALLRNLEAISLRTFMEKSGATEDPLQEERDIAIENLTKMFYTVLLPQQIEQGNISALQDFVVRIDDDGETVRSAVLQTIKELEIAAGPVPGQGGNGQGPGDVIQQMRSLASGGIPGQAAGQPEPPTIGRDLQNMLPSGQRRLVSETAPGGTAA
ncbi:hypothetical protein LCGC14_1249180 [marine sediment metagenome]|uniref:Portal protein n=1 Tax=marine sediment metagenome TaxID=412755 RepID=A0A0F9NKV6_9ZZZZ